MLQKMFTFNSLRLSVTVSPQSLGQPGSEMVQYEDNSV